MLRHPLCHAAVVTMMLIAASTASAADLSGTWSGRWESFDTGHNGPLNATFSRVSDDQYQVQFRGRFLKIVPFRYRVTLNIVEENDDRVTLAGESYLGRLFGTFTYQATADDESFTADYSSCKDQGRFTLCRRSYACVPAESSCSEK